MTAWCYKSDVPITCWSVINRSTIIKPKDELLWVPLLLLDSVRSSDEKELTSTSLNLRGKQKHSDIHPSLTVAMLRSYIVRIRIRFHQCLPSRSVMGQLQPMECSNTRTCTTILTHTIHIETWGLSKSHWFAHWYLKYRAKKLVAKARRVISCDFHFISCPATPFDATPILCTPRLPLHSVPPS